MADKKLLSFISKLYHRTQDGRVSWDRTVEEGVFQSAFPGYAVTIFARPNRGDRDMTDTVIQIHNEDGQLIEEIVDEDFQEDSIGGQPAWRAMLELYTDARRIAMGVDQAIDTLLRELGEDDEALPF